MPEITVNGARLHYTESGSGGESFVFSHGLLCNGRMFDRQVEALRDRYRCITYDHRGQGSSEVTDGGYGMDSLTEDAAAVIEQLEASPCHFAGLSMGGFVGMRLAARRPELLRSLTLFDTSAEAEPKKALRRYRLLNFIARWFGIGPVTGRVMPILFGKKFLRDPARAELRREWKRRIASNHRIGITRAVAGVLERAGVEDEIERIEVPTLVIVGDQDVATPPSLSKRIQARIRGSKLVVILGAGHTSTVEEPEAVNLAIERFLTELNPNP